MRETDAPTSIASSIIAASRLPTDDELARRSQTGDREALDQLLRRHHERIFALCRRLTGNQADALDAAQEALITIARRIDRFDGRSSFGTWAYRVATNACLDELRRRKRRPEPFDPTDPPAVGRVTTAADHAAGGRRGSDDPAAVVADRLAIDAALARLPDEFRVAVVLRDLLTFDYAEIAEVLDIPIGTVRSRLARGRALLARQLQERQADIGGNQTGRAARPTEKPAGAEGANAAFPHADPTVTPPSRPE